MKFEFGRGTLLLVLTLLGQPTVAQETAPKPKRALPTQLRSAAIAPTTNEAPIASAASFQGITRPMVLPASPATELTNGILAFDREIAETRITDDAPEARFVFNLTNISAMALTITNVALSCGCTAVELPPLPWVLRPGEFGRLPVTLEVAGKSGVIAKTLQVRTDRGSKTIQVKAEVNRRAETSE